MLNGHGYKSELFKEPGVFTSVGLLSYALVELCFLCLGEMFMGLCEENEVLRFWFEELTPSDWFKNSEEIDELVRERFGTTVRAALEGRLDPWSGTAEGSLALILLIDQFTRNIYRDTPEAFAGDAKALEISLRCVELGFVEHEKMGYRHFMLIPMMHSEDLEIQDRSLSLFEKYTDEKVLGFARRHRAIIARFGRYPHRNRILGRDSTSEEIEFLKEPGSSF